MRALVLSAGLGTRFKSEKPKVMHNILGKPMLWYVLKTLKELHIENIALVVGYKAEQIREYFGDSYHYFYQSNPKGGTGDAVLSAIDFWRDYDGYMLVINGDSPLVKSQTLKNMQRYLHMVEEYEGIKLSALLLSTQLPDPTGYGRIIKDERGNVIKVVEEKDASFEEKLIKEINGGVYIFYCPHLVETLFHVKPSPKTGEVYLTEVFNLMHQKGYTVRSFMAEDPTEVLGANTRWELAIAENVIRLRILQEWAEKGNTIHQPESVWIEPDVVLEGDVEIYPDVMLRGNTRLGRGVLVGKGSLLENSVVEEGAVIEAYSIVRNSHIKSGAVIGPFAHVRENSLIGKGSHIGNFVEVKKSFIGEGVRAKHLAYIGDATIEDDVNVGAGVVFANFDGKRKHQSYVGRGAFIGSNSLIIAPIRLGNYSFVAGGSVINKDVPDGDLAIERSKLRILKGKGKEKLLE
ncbi:bifunctional UDP-N-acetylglucosamine diphosphorylase/glucosamine-1-phosphate N-acetyltransferase GlmU [Pampinifervens florentissimum]|uniref:bifunctional UDP-N-acetylglucosamine diphosphorylase/glucosamine-1-phosphate N-acetyltransferase GlmU n=1 Tax=Pampinifervens florentissimum TaxID=1632019 RepID=UPI0013B47BED|nr:bifunctional UDP-N-acetylglucosamine diphosphorylase/glucosamine-1-phosphate N-acetyltransferase GlmU [Hydrogenobacter sp. T-8]QID33242.1 UDP-N-acetylglucosamine diphosphorylase/glucosamine-1-phosphate N-acetyltransferase [Hydrogenobacter sp. T-8]